MASRGLRSSIVNVILLLATPYSLFARPAFASMSPAFEISGTNVRTGQQLAAAPGQRDHAVDHDIAAMGELERVVGVLLDQEHGDAVARIELAQDADDLLGDERPKPQRGLVEQQQPRPTHQGAGDREHLLLAARQGAAALAQA